MYHFQLSNGKIIFLAVVCLLLFSLAGAFIILNKRKSTELIRPVMDDVKVEVKDNLVEDVWGLRVFYPQDMKVMAATKEGELTRYDFTHPNHPGYITIFTKETDATTVKKWVEGDKESATASGILDTTIDGRDGKKMRFSNPTRTRAVTVDSWQVFVFDSYPQQGAENYWDDMFNRIVAKFEFLPFEDDLVESSLPSVDYPSVDSEIIEFAEEVIE